MGMGHKTLITICQSGGEFVKNKDDGSLSYINKGVDAHAIDIDNETKFDDFKLELAGLWNYSPESVTIKYILPSHGKTLITITSDRDLKRMIEFHENSPIADVFVIARDVVTDVSDRPSASRPSKSSMSEAVVPIVVDTLVDGKIVNSVEPDPVCDVPLESMSPNQPPAIVVTASASAAEHHRGVELENTTGVDQMVTNVHESRKAAIQRSVALILMKYNDYDGARKKLIEAQTSYPGIEYVDELIKLCDVACTAKSQGSGVDWYSVLGIIKTADMSDIDFKYKELMRTLEPIKNKFPEIQSALGLIGKDYSEFDSRGAASLVPCGSVKPLDIAHSGTVNVNMRATSQVSSGTKRNVSEGSDKSSLICNSVEQTMKRVRSLGGNDFEVMEETQSLNILVGKFCGQEASSGTAKRKTRLNEVEGSLGRSAEGAVKALVHKEPALEFHDFSNHKKAGVFTVGQFLAVYDQEKMPRLYAQILGIESCYKKETNSTDNILYVRWLRPAPINPDERKWHEAGLPVSCGFFKIDSVGKCNIGVISHLVSSFQEYHYSDKLFELYPREGEVWALYEEWKTFDWCSDPKTRTGCKFLLVEILSDYSPAAGVKVASLGKVAGYSTIFRRSGLSYQISAIKLFGFSHNIPVRSTGDMKGLFAGTVLDLIFQYYAPKF